ncbi:hypothetical protein, partial [Paucilactobacillus suebicus]|uniref:hypothetical protein n=1 Tax=Paucilactobacillus suebicus TaxID=152335 RepID=UPI001F1A94AD
RIRQLSVPEALIKWTSALFYTFQNDSVSAFKLKQKQDKNFSQGENHQVISLTTHLTPAL